MRVRFVTFPLPTIVLDGEVYEVTSKGNVAACPECAGPIVWDGGLWHCDNPDGSSLHGAWDPSSIVKVPVGEASGQTDLGRIEHAPEV